MFCFSKKKIKIQCTMYNVLLHIKMIYVEFPVQHHTLSSRKKLPQFSNPEETEE